MKRVAKTVLSVIRPTVAMKMIDNVELQKIAEAVEGPSEEGL